MKEQKPRASGWSRYRGFESVPVRVSVRVGRGSLSLARLSDLAHGDVIDLDRALGAPFELVAGDVLLGHVEPVVTEQTLGLKLLAPPEKEGDESTG